MTLNYKALKLLQAIIILEIVLNFTIIIIKIIISEFDYLAFHYHIIIYKQILNYGEHNHIGILSICRQLKNLSMCYL